MKRHSTITTAVLGLSTAQVLAPNTKRTALLFLAPIGANSYSVAPTPAVVSGVGVNLSSNTTPVLLTYDDLGDIVQKAWYGIASGALTPFGAIETVEVE
jgi:hypothetical protein